MYRLVLISLPHSLKSKARLASYSIGRWGRSCGARTSDHVIAPSNGSSHYGGPYTTGGIIYRVALRDKYSRGLSHMLHYININNRSSCFNGNFWSRCCMYIDVHNSRFRNTTELSYHICSCPSIRFNMRDANRITLIWYNIIQIPNDKVE